MRRIISIKEFFITLGLGLWQAICYICRIFNPQHKTKFWRVIWSVFAVCIVIFTGIFCYMFYTEELNKPEYAEDRTWLSDDVYAYQPYKELTYICNYDTGKKTVKDVAWYHASPDKQDSLVVYAQYGKRGYFNAITGEVALKPIYHKAWIFSESLAAVVLKDSLYFINHNGNKLFGFPYPRMKRLDPNRSFCFHNGLCIMYNENDKLGLIDKKGHWVLPAEYDEIEQPNNESNYYKVEKENKQDNTSLYGLVDKTGRMTVPCEYKEIEVTLNDGIFLSMEDNTQRHADYEGNLTDEFVCYNICNLSYELEETVDDGEGGRTNKIKFAPLMSYAERSGYMGLIDKNGRRITPPLYQVIAALNENLYKCGYDNNYDNAVLINGKGEVVKQ